MLVILARKQFRTSLLVGTQHAYYVVFIMYNNSICDWI